MKELGDESYHNMDKALKNAVKVLTNEYSSMEKMQDAMWEYRKAAAVFYKKNQKAASKNSAPAYLKYGKEAAEFALAQMPKLSMQLNTVKHYMAETEEKTLDGKPFCEASYGAVSEQMEALGKRYHDVKPLGAEMVQFVQNSIVTESKHKSDFLKQIEDQLGRKINTQLLHKGPENYLSPLSGMSIEQRAQEYLAVKYIDRVMSQYDMFDVDKAINDLGGEIHELKDAAKKLSQNKVFQAVAKARPDDLNKVWKEIESDAADMQGELKEDLREYQKGGYAKYILQGIKVEVEAAGEKREMSNTLDDKYQRLAQVITAQILTAPNQIQMLQGMAAGMFDTMELKTAAMDYVMDNKVLEKENGDLIGKKELNELIAGGKLKDMLISNVVQKSRESEIRRPEHSRNHHVERVSVAK